MGEERLGDEGKMKVKWSYIRVAVLLCKTSQQGERKREGNSAVVGGSFSSGSVQVLTRLEWTGRRGLGRFICPVVITAATVKILIINSTI